MSSNLSIKPNTAVNAGEAEVQEDQIVTTIVAEMQTHGVQALPLHGLHSPEKVNEKPKLKKRGPRKRSSTSRGAASPAEGSTSQNPDKTIDNADEWNWLLKVEDNYQEAIASATTELQNRVHVQNSGPESEDEDDERNYKYYYRGPEPEEPTRATTLSSEPWFAAGYADYRDSYPSSESDEEDEAVCNGDSEAETGDNETTVPTSSLCGVCRKEECECTSSILTGLAGASLSEDVGDVYSPAS